MQKFTSLSATLFGGLAVALSAALLPFSASANDENCRPLIKKMQEAQKARTKVRIDTENYRNGKLFLRSYQLMEKHGDFLVESIDQKQWSRQHDGGFYNSTDGKTWKLLSAKDPNWQENWEKVNNSIVEGAIEMKCDFTEDVEGKSYPGMEYRVVTEKPYKLDYKTRQIFHPETHVLIRTTDSMGGHDIINTYKDDSSISLSPPE